jgi:hypothetical protein
MVRLLVLLVLVVVAPVAPSAAGEETRRVLVLGDPLQHNLLNAAAKELGPEVRIEFPSIEAYDTGTALVKIDKLLGEPSWDLIYFNFGLGDLFYKDPRSREIRAMSKQAGGVRVSPPEQYRSNLETLVQRLKKTDAKLLWASTTPMVNVNAFPGYMGNVYDANSELPYNEIAKKIMTLHGVPILDLHAFVMAQFGPEEKHPGHDGYQKALSGRRRGKEVKGSDKPPMHQPVVEAIRQQLK